MRAGEFDLSKRHSTEKMGMHSGFVAILGPPNAGKSTFLNEILGFKLAITSDKPQTTRHRLLGVYNAKGVQAVFLDTPGLHQGKGALNKRMMETAVGALTDVDAVLFMVDVTRRGMVAGERTADVLKAAGKPTVLALNKIDLLPNKIALLDLIERASSWGEWRAVVPISALKGDGADLAVKELTGLLPMGASLFPPDMITDLSLRFLAGELIREKIFHMTEQEVPYQTAVTVDEFIEPAAEGRPTAISATIHVERPGQKGIIIGKKGAMLKKIGSAARKDMETLVGTPVFLDLFVRVEPDWSRRARGLQKMGY